MTTEVAKASKDRTRITVQEDNGIHIQSVEGQPVFGSRDEDFIFGLAQDMIRSSRYQGELVEHRLKFISAFVENLSPRDEVEALLATQMAVTHQALMEASNRYGNAVSLEQADSAERAMNKLARTFTTQMDALKKNRAEPTVVKVRDVNVADGGQAIVGNVSSGKSGNDKS